MEQFGFIVAVNFGPQVWKYLRFGVFGGKRWTDDPDEAHAFASPTEARSWMSHNVQDRDYDVWCRTRDMRRVNAYRIKSAWQEVCGGNMPGCTGGPTCKSDHK